MSKAIANMKFFRLPSIFNNRMSLFISRNIWHMRFINACNLTEAVYTRCRGIRELEHQIGRLSNLSQIFQIIKSENIPGDIVELGIFQGYSLHWLYRFRRRYKLGSKRIIGIDSFQGLPESSGKWKKGAFSDTSVDLVYQNLNKHIPNFEDGNISILKGLFADEHIKSLLSNGTDNICLVHIDCDLRTSAKDSLRLIEPFIKGKCFICFDDWGNDHGEIPVAYEEFRQENQRLIWKEFSATKFTKYFEVTPSKTS